MSKRMTSCLILTLTTLLFTIAAQAAIVDLSTWTAYSVNLPGGQGNSNWVLSNGNTTVTQTINADPSYFMNNTSQSEYQITGSWRCTTSSDNDFIGFAFGWQDPAHCYILDWKQGAQNTYGASAEEGLTVKKLAAPSEADLELADFWTSTDNDHTEILATNYGSTMGWATNVTYGFTLTFTPGEFRIVVTEGATVIWDVTITDSTYTDGEFGFYNFSQGSVEYSGFDQNLEPECDAGGPYAGEAGVPVTFDGSASFDPDAEGAIVAWEWDFGDGTTGSGEVVEHTYAEDGLYMVSLCVTDDRGATRCCETAPVVPNEDVSWSGLKQQYR